MKTRNLFMAALATLAFVGCTSDEFVGENSPNALQNANGAINFGYNVQNMTRADITGGDAATKLGNAMLVYGVKQNRTTNTNYDDVFVNYSVKYSTAQAANDEYNAGWYYVAAEAGQTIKYWDWASADYHFVAGSPVDKFTFNKNGTTHDIETATVTGLGGRLNHGVSVASTASAVYIADAKVVAKGAYNAPVSFTFRSLQTKVRVGIYETIPGYSISSITFYDNAATPNTSNYITLNCATDDYFVGGSAVTGTVTYDWAVSPANARRYTFAYTSGTTTGKCWEGGQYTSGVTATSSTDANLWGASDDDDTNGYYIVMPTPSATVAAPLTLKCDYTLEATDGHGETIQVTGATATIPSAYTKWDANTAYTYIFKISDNTNGTTGTVGTDPVGLYPITFDAVVVNTEDGMVGTETTVSTPSITASQDGFVVAAGITYKAGAVTLTAMNGTEDVSGAPTTWHYVDITGAYDYSKDYEHLGTAGAGTTWTDSKLTTLVAGHSYVVKVVTASGTAYLVIEVPSV